MRDVWSPFCPPSLARAVGGVVVDRDHEVVLLRQVAGGFGGCAWTPLGKGRPERGETDEIAALREVREELGARAVIEQALDGYWLGSTTGTRLFLMRAVGALAPHDAETSAVRWLTFAQALAFVSLSLEPRVRARDLAVLACVAAIIAS